MQCQFQPVAALVIEVIDGGDGTQLLLKQSACERVLPYRLIVKEVARQTPQSPWVPGTPSAVDY